MNIWHTLRSTEGYWYAKKFLLDFRGPLLGAVEGAIVRSKLPDLDPDLLFTMGFFPAILKQKEIQKEQNKSFKEAKKFETETILQAHPLVPLFGRSENAGNQQKSEK